MKRHITLMGDLGGDGGNAFWAICDKARRTMGDLQDSGGFFSGTPYGMVENILGDPQGVAQQVQNDPAALAQLSAASGTPPAQVLAAAQQATGTGTKSNYDDLPSSGGGSSTASGAHAGAGLTTGSKVAIAAVLAATAYYVAKAKGMI